MTSTSLKTEWVFRELCVAWGIRKWIVPIVVGIGIDRLSDWIKGFIITDANSKQQLLKLVEDIGNRCRYAVRPMTKILSAFEKLTEFI